LPGNWHRQTQVSAHILMPPWFTAVSAPSNSLALGWGYYCEADRCFPVKQFREATVRRSFQNGAVSNTPV